MDIIRFVNKSQFYLGLYLLVVDRLVKRNSFVVASHFLVKHILSLYVYMEVHYSSRLRLYIQLRRLNDELFHVMCRVLR